MMGASVGWRMTILRSSVDVGAGLSAYIYPSGGFPLGDHPANAFCSMTLLVFLPVICDWKALVAANKVSIRLPSGLSSMIGWLTEMSCTSCFRKIALIWR